MSIILYFLTHRLPVPLHNVEAIRDEGNSTVTVTNAFGGEPKRFEQVKRIDVKPDAPDTE